MKKCPRCELNYIQDDKELCPVCQKEIEGKEDNEDAAILDNLYSMVSGGRGKRQVEKQSAPPSKEDLEEDLPMMDGYSDLMDTEIPECDLEKLPLEDEDEEEEELD